MSMFVRVWIVVVVMVVGWVTVAGATVLDDFTTALKTGTPDLDVLASYEYKHRDDATSPGKQFSLRTRLGYRTGTFYDVELYAQFHNLTNVQEEFRFPGGGDADRDIIADPDGNRLYKAFLDYKGVPDTLIRVGRQEIILDDARLLGNIGWRLNGQSFDAVSVTNTRLKDLKIYAGYANQVNTIFLTHVDLDHFYLLNAKYSPLEHHSISFYTYLLDTESAADTARDCATYGFRFVGKPAPFNYYIDYSHQSDFADGEDHDADMLNLFVGGKIASKVDLGVGYSYISGQDGNDRPFDTLYSTAHKFNGFADAFLATNGGGLTGGLQDYYVSASTKAFGCKFVAVYHYFDTVDDEAFDGIYGDEVDLVFVKSLNKNIKLLIKYANFMQDDNASSGFANPTVDTEILTARLQYTF
ncbi:MAG: alginate export family protein [Thermodesulfobacteriota bacterium]|nr:alginate export family protein [Thermodesulfobacteriota bacterium]